MSTVNPNASTNYTPQQPSLSSSSSAPLLERELPMLAGIGAFVTWCEDLLAVLSGPILTAGLAIALVDLLSDGQLFTRLPMLLWVWAGSMALGLDAQFIGSAAKLARAIRQRKGWPIFGYIILCTSLGYVAFLATYVFAVQEANGLTTAAALGRLGMDGTSWIFQRSVLAVVLVFLSGFLRYVAPATSAVVEAQSEREHLERELALAPLRQQLRAQQARGMRSVVGAALGREGTQGQGGIAVAAATLPSLSPQMHHESVPVYKAMHDWDDAAADYGMHDDIDDEVEGDSDLFSTGQIDAIDLRTRVDSRPETSQAKQRARGKTHSGPTARNHDVAKSVRKAQADMRREAKLRRRGEIRDAVYAVMDEWYAAGSVENLSDKELARRVAKRVDFAVNPSGNTVGRWRGPWQSSRAHKAALLANDLSDIEPMEPQEIRELQEVWA